MFVKARHANYTMALCLTFVLVVVFLLPSSWKSYACIGFASLIFFSACMSKSESLGLSTRRFSRPLILLVLAMLLTICIVVAFSPYSKVNLVVTSMFLMLCLLVFPAEKTDASSECHRAVKSVFYWVALSIVVVEMADNIGVFAPMYINDAYDKNYMGIVLFLLFCWSLNEKRKIGILVCVLSAFFLGSRNYVIMLLMATLILCFVRYKDRKGRVAFLDKPLAPIQVFSGFVLMLAFIGGFSFWWSANVVGTSTTSWGVSINDTSNAIRFSSNEYALVHILENPELLIYGYDQDIIEAMGIIQNSSLDGTETALDGTFHNGYRIVQPHHSVLNMVLKEGVAFSIVYFLILSYLLAPFLTIRNASIWLPYAFASMFMHSLLSGYYLLFLVILLFRACKGNQGIQVLSESA